MNKKIFTLLASTLVLFVTAFGSYAQPWRGERVSSALPTGTNETAYHLQIAKLGANVLGGDPYNASTGAVLAVDEAGNLAIQSASYYAGISGDEKSLERLHRALWCAASEGTNAHHDALLKFTNKQTLADLAAAITSPEYPATPWPSRAPKLALTDVDAIKTGADQGYPRIKIYRVGQRVIEGNATPDSLVMLGGDLDTWEAGNTTVSVQDTFYLRAKHPTRADYYYTFAVADTTAGNYGSRGLVLAEVHFNDFNDTTKFAREHLVKFHLRTTVPRLLTAKDILSLLGNKDENSGLKTKDNYTTGPDDPFLDINEVIDGGAIHYVRLKTSNGQYITVNGTLYYPGISTNYPTITTSASPDAVGQSDFRFVYYPSDGDVVINVRTKRTGAGETDYIRDIVTPQINDDFWTTNSASNELMSTEDYFTWTIANDLLVQIQQIERNNSFNVPTVFSGAVSSVKGQYYFPVGRDRGCKAIEDKRATVPVSALYLIKSTDGKYLTVPLYTGGFSPTWTEATEDVAKKTPAFHWLVKKWYNSPASKVEITNREFPEIKFDYVQLYNEPREFSTLWTLDRTGEYGTIVSNTKVSIDGFVELTGEYITNPALGYKRIVGTESAAESYAFKYYHAYRPNTFYISAGLRKGSPADTTLKADADADKKTYFTFREPDALAQGAKTEKFGITEATYAAAGLTPARTPVVLERGRYSFAINAYSTDDANGEVLTVRPDRSYVHTKETGANENTFGAKSEFYFRYAHDKDGEPYYTILQYFAEGDFRVAATEFGYSVADTLWKVDPVSGTGRSFGLLLWSVHDQDLQVRATPRYGTTDVASTFALVENPEPFYRRLDAEGLGLTEEIDETKPVIVKIYRAATQSAISKEYLYEDQHSAISYKDEHDKDRGPWNSSAYGNGINYLSYISKAADDQHDKNNDGGWYPHNFNLYVEHAYTDPDPLKKPQYLIAVDVLEDQLGYPSSCPTCSDLTNIPEQKYKYGRYLINARDSAYKSKLLNAPVNNPDYISGEQLPRLAFVSAVYSEDHLYILPTQRKYAIDNSGKIVYDPLWQYIDTLDGAYGGRPAGTPYLNFEKLIYGQKDKTGKEVVPGIGIDARKDVKDKFHNEWLFSFRFVDRKEGPTGRFYIESETHTPGQWFAPGEGGWLKIGADGLVEISRGLISYSIADAEEWQLELDADGIATGTDPVVATSSVRAIAGEGSVTILNAAGKRVVISNILGQTVSKAVLTSDAATLSAPKGVVLIAVEGEPALKAIVK